ncbi:Pentatricopeptide repeat-containing protein [Camellia lanceoleosa]|uniref:Pentatricopeptide repeat-containing protein n=1 Tax=Camellia lanceoleosa TaxID=1840588 RepID=A0ACC0GAI4_9ERIC|nr:Pentatricopeptide repeat-containing protein [Camellia lanceoleosa]
MKNSGVQPDRHFYNVMIDAFGKYNCLDHAMTTFERMRSEGIEPDNESGFTPCTTTYNIMINSFGEQERWAVKSLLGKMQNQGLLPNVVTYTTLGLSEEAVNAFRIMRADGLKPSSLALNSLINAFGEDRRDAEAFSVLQYMKENDLKADVVTYTHAYEKL